jgi:hypothetical protein|tara:strand:+ start:914 stop:2242 length:1329 start_codon:yes stop_codon:yes gene_type:complete
MIIQDLSEQLIIDSLSDYLNNIETKRTREREYLLDFYEGFNMENYVGEYFGSESLQQVPMFAQNLTRRVCKARGQAYKRPPRMKVDDRYKDFADIQDLNAKRRQLEQTTFLLGTMGFRSLWNPRRNRVEFELLPFVEPLFLPGEKEPFGCIYAIENEGLAKLTKQEFIVWTAERDGKPGRHFGIDANGDKFSFNEGDVNPYGIIPVSFVHRYPPIRDFFVGGAEDVVRADLALSVAAMEISLCIRLGAIGVKFVTGVDDRSRISMGVDKILYLPEGANFGVTGPSASISDLILGAKYLVETTLNNNQLRVKFIDSHGNAESAEALRVQEIDNYTEVQANIEDTWRAWEHRRFEIDRRIIEVQTGKKLADEYLVDFEEPQVLSPSEEREMFTWLFQNKLATRQSYLMLKNPDMLPEDAEALLSEVDESEAQPEQNRLLNRLQS